MGFEARKPRLESWSQLDITIVSIYVYGAPISCLTITIIAKIPPLRSYISVILSNHINLTVHPFGFVYRTPQTMLTYFLLLSTAKEFIIRSKNNNIIRSENSDFRSSVGTLIKATPNSSKHYYINKIPVANTFLRNSKVICSQKTQKKNIVVNKQLNSFYLKKYS